MDNTNESGIDSNLVTHPSDFGATSEEITEAIWVAADMCAGGAYAHSVLALETIKDDPET